MSKDFSIQGLNHSWLKSYVNFWVHCHAATLFPWNERHGMGSSRTVNASKQNKMGAVDAQRDQIKSGLKQQKANTILQMELQHTQVQLITLSWYDSTSNHQKECSKSDLIQLYFPTLLQETVEIFHCRSVRQITYGTSLNSKNKTCLC